jgi:hypothetical protein
LIYLVVPIMTMQLLLLSSFFRVTTEFGYDAALPAPTGAGENWGPAPGADGFGAAAGFEAATGAANVRGGGCRRHKQEDICCWQRLFETSPAQTFLGNTPWVPSCAVCL